MLQALQSRLENALLRVWVQRTIFARLAWPLSLIFGSLVQIRRLLFKHSIFRIRRVDAFVIVVGNVVVGGTGKTPTVISIAKHLTNQGHRVGVISRGFGRRSNVCVEVTSISNIHDVGDEPALIHRSTHLPVFVSRNRYEAATALLAKYPDTKIIISDDGLQHYKLYRDLEICLFDSRGCGNGWLLPAGPLREPWPRSALHKAGQRAERLLVLHTGGASAVAGYRTHRSLKPCGLHQDGSTTSLTTLCKPNSKPIMAIAGIAQPEKFFAMLRTIGLPLAKTLALPDHYDFDNFEKEIDQHYQLVCTEKDALKLWQKSPSAIAIELIQTTEPAFFKQVEVHIANHETMRLSSQHECKIV